MVRFVHHTINKERMDNYHLTKKGDQWRCAREKSDRAIKTFSTKDEAKAFAVPTCVNTVFIKVQVP